MSLTGSYRLNCNLCGDPAVVTHMDGFSTVRCLACDHLDELPDAVKAATRQTLLQDLHQDLMLMLAQHTDKPALFPQPTDVLPERASRWCLTSKL